MWFVYKVDDYLLPVVQGICDTLVNDCVKATRIDTQIGAGLPSQFRVSKNTVMDERGMVVKVEGFNGTFNFRLRSDKDGFNFAVENYTDPEHIFYHFVSMIQVYRSKTRLALINLDYICNITEADSPPLTPGNYAAVTDAPVTDIQRLLDKEFDGSAFQVVDGKYTIIVYCENAKRPSFPDKYIPICKKYIDDFKATYFFNEVMLFCIRIRGNQYVYFCVKDAGLYCNTQDAGRGFLGPERGHLFKSLSNLAEDFKKYDITIKNQ